MGVLPRPTTMGKGKVSGEHDTSTGMKDFDDDNVDEMDLILVDGCLCCNETLYCEIPECIGCSAKEECCCMSCSWCLKCKTAPICCKPPPDHVCQLGIGCLGCGCKCNDIACCLGQAQLCCCVWNAAYPPTEEVPLTCALLGLACFPSCGCCKKLGDLTGYDDAKRQAKKEKKYRKKHGHCEGDVGRT